MQHANKVQRISSTEYSATRQQNTIYHVHKVQRITPTEHNPARQQDTMQHVNRVERITPTQYNAARQHNVTRHVIIMQGIASTQYNAVRQQSTIERAHLESELLRPVDALLLLARLGQRRLRPRRQLGALLDGLAQLRAHRAHSLAQISLQSRMRRREIRRGRLRLRLELRLASHASFDLGAQHLCGTAKRSGDERAGHACAITYSDGLKID
eukprot:3164369-Pleurochrysis_carterae.AAC.1